MALSLLLRFKSLSTFFFAATPLSHGPRITRPPPPPRRRPLTRHDVVLRRIHARDVAEALKVHRLGREQAHARRAAYAQHGVGRGVGLDAHDDLEVCKWWSGGGGMHFVSVVEPPLDSSRAEHGAPGLLAQAQNNARPLRRNSAQALRAP